MATEPDKVTILGMRDSLKQQESELVAALGPPNEDVEEFYSTVPLPDGYEVRVKVFRSKKTPATERPLIVMFHGGGFMSGSLEQCTRPGREFAEDLGAVVVSGDYRLAPEHEFPGPVQDGLDVISWLDQNAEQALGASLTKGFVVGGLSAGGTIAAVAPLQIKNLQHPITGSFLGIPMLFTKEVVPEKYKHMYTSHWEPRDGPFNQDFMENFFRMLRLDVHHTSPLFSPANHPGELIGLPRTYIQTGGKDPFRDDGRVYSKLLEDAGQDFRYDCHEKIGHGCYSIWTTEIDLPALKQKTMEGMAWLLRKDWP